jgi:hypothetical protein
VSRIGAYLFRFAVILVGYTAASLAASAFIHVLFIGWSGLFGEELPPAVATGMMFSIPFVALFVAYFVFIPSAIAIIVAEVLGKRDWLFYALAGGAVGLAFIGFLYENADPDFAVTGTPAVLGIVGGGMIGGLAYWLIAGRSTASWRTQQRPPELPTSPGPSGS